MNDVLKLLPNNALAMDNEQLACRLEELATRIRNGQFERLERIIVLIDCMPKIQRRVYGRPTTNMELVGLLEYTKHDVINQQEA